MQTHSYSQAMHWSIELFGEGNLAQFWIAPSEFQLAEKNEDSLSITVYPDHRYGLAMGPHPEIRDEWQEFSISASVSKDLTSNFTLRGQFAGYVIDSDPFIDSPYIELLIGKDEVIERFLTQHAPQSAVFPGDPEIQFWCGVISSESELLAVAALCKWQSGEMMVSSVATATQARGRGFGKILLTGLLGEAARRGHRRVGLAVMRKNVPARALYESLGFRCMGDYRHFERKTE